MKAWLARGVDEDKSLYFLSPGSKKPKLVAETWSGDETWSGLADNYHQFAATYWHRVTKFRLKPGEVKRIELKATVKKLS